MTGGDELRHIVVDISLANSAGAYNDADIKSRVVLTWGGMFGFYQQTVTITRGQAMGSISMRMTGVKDYVADWNIINE